MDNKATLDDNRDRKLVVATKGLRLLNYLFDTVFVSVSFMFLGVISGIIHAGTVDAMATNTDLRLLFQLMIMVASWTYYTMMETAFDGRTVGKFITNTRVLRADGQFPEPKHIAFRSLCRLIPFEFISFLLMRSGGWHDQFSGTMVFVIERSENK
mgnify:CR=1 FL=1